MENDNFHFFSKGEFVLGFLKGYARHLGLDSEEVLQRYRIQSELDNRKETFQQLPLFSPPVPPAEEIARAEPAPQRLPPLKDRRRSRRSIFVQVAIVLAALSLSFYLHHLMKQGEDARKSPGVKGAFSREAQGSAGKHSYLESQKVRVIGNRSQKSYSLPGMKDYDRVGSIDRVEFNSEEEAVKAGYYKARE